MARERPDNSYVPTDYEDLYRYYIRTPGTVSLAEATIKRAIPTADYEQLQELAHEAFLRMKRFTILERFDADKSNFGGMVFVAARSAAVNWLSRNEHDPNGALRGGSLVETQRTTEKGEGTRQRTATQARREPLPPPRDADPRHPGRGRSEVAQGERVHDRGLQQDPPRPDEDLHGRAGIRSPQRHPAVMGGGVWEPLRPHTPTTRVS
jgi:hypothetical protein